MNRAAFWLVGVGWGVSIAVVGGATLAFGGSSDDMNAVGYLGMAAVSLMMLGAFWSGLCIGVKRYHDLGKSGVWVLIQFVPVVGSLWYFIEAGCFRGVAGANIYGADPLATTARLRSAGAFAA